MKKVVVIGGGSGIFNVLKGLKNYPVELTSIVTSFDNGGSAGILRDEFGTLPQGDIRRSILALSPDNGTRILRDLLSFRFPKKSSLKGHSFGNLFLQALAEISGSEIGAIKSAREIFGIKQNILPISLDDANLYARLENGKIIKGETNIDIPKHNGNVKIKEIFLKPKANISKEAFDEIVSADFIIFGPGDLYTSILPNTIVNGFDEAIKSTKAKIIYILNIMTKWGETNNLKASDFVRILNDHLFNKEINYVIANNGKINKKAVIEYKKEKSIPIKIDTMSMKRFVKNIIIDNIIIQKSSEKISAGRKMDIEIIRHDPKKISRVLMKIINN